MTKQSKTENAHILTATAAQIAAIFEVSERTVRDWANRRDMPKLAHGRYNVRDVLLWWLENMYSPVTQEAKDAQTRYWEAKADREEIKRDQEKGRLIPDDEIALMWTARMREVSSGLEAFGSRVASLVVGKNQLEVQRICEEEQWKLRDSFCRTGRFCHPLSTEFFDRLKQAWDDLKSKMDAGS